MASVKAWTKLNNYSYNFLDDAFFDAAPAWFRDAVNGQRHLVSDIARLELAHQYLAGEWDKVIWIDADVFICNIENFKLDLQSNFLLCREVWMTQKNEEAIFSYRVNNSILMFSQKSQFLNFYRHACKKIILSKKGALRHTEIGTNFLTGIPQQLPLIKTAVIFSPYVLNAFYRNDTIIIDQYMNELSAPIHAVNLCLTFRDTLYKGLLLDDNVFSIVIDRLKQMHGLQTT
jgi:hypothetical protein